MSRALCVCGRSQTLPFCDGAHVEEGWACQAEASWAALAVAASARWQNLARRLAHEVGGRLVEPGAAPARAERLVLLVDAGDLDGPRALAAQVEADEQVVMALGVAARALAPAFPGARLVDLGAAGPLEAFHAAQRALEAAPSEGAAQPSRLRSLFVSHAVADEELLLPAAAALRAQHGAALFLCADSLAMTQDWQAGIQGALRDHDAFVLLVSEASRASHFCSFEVGYGLALDKPMALVSLDGTMPPAFVQHLQCADLPRRGAARPWVERGDLLVEALLEVAAG